MTLTTLHDIDLEQAAALKALVTRLPQGLCLFDASDHLVLANAAFQAMLELPALAAEPGVSLDELLDASPREETRRLLSEVCASCDRFDGRGREWLTGDGARVAIACESLPGGGYAVLCEPMTNGAAQWSPPALRDPLTGLLNRAAILREATQLMDRRAGHDGDLALLCLELERLKPVNDTLGRPAGDSVLKAVGERLKASVRSSDSLARIGGDAFALLQNGEPQPHGSLALARRVIAALAEPFVIDGHTVNLGVGIGVAVAPSDADNAEDLLRNADLALSAAKADGPGSLHYFQPQMRRRAQARRAMEDELRDAIAGDRFELHYQPVMDLAAERIVVAEALVRWRRSEAGLTSPAEFIPVAEESGLIVPLGALVLRQACRDAAAWPGGLRAAVNVSPVQLRDRQFVATVRAALDAAGLPADRLELEVTETALIADAEPILAVLNELRSMGMKIALDDFGTGYSSISYLRRFPFDKIKIDRSFVTGAQRDPEAAALVRMIAALGASLRVDTIAEGVETVEDLELVRAAGCTHAQGYLLSRPVSQQDLMRLLAGRATSAQS